MKTHRVRMLTALEGETISLAFGQETERDPAEALDWIAKGIAVSVRPPSSKQEIETATADPVAEKAVRPSAKRRRRGRPKGEK